MVVGSPILVPGFDCDSREHGRLQQRPDQHPGIDTAPTAAATPLPNITLLRTLTCAHSSTNSNGTLTCARKPGTASKHHCLERPHTAPRTDTCSVDLAQTRKTACPLAFELFGGLGKRMEPALKKVDACLYVCRTICNMCHALVARCAVKVQASKAACLLSRGLFLKK